MQNSTILRPDSEQLDIDPDAAAFACLQPRAACAAFSLHQAASIHFGFKPKSQWWAMQLLARQAGEAGGFDARHKQWQAFWPHLKISAVEDKVTVYNRKLKEDQRLSGFYFVAIDSSRTTQTEEGEFRRLPTYYGEGDFWPLFRYAQELRFAGDLMVLSRTDRLRRYLTIIEEWAAKRGCQKIERGPKDEEVKPAKPTLPCRCACASCESCAAKPEVKQPRSTPGLIKQRITAAVDALYDAGQAWKDLGLDEREYWRLFNAGIGDLETRMSAPAPPRVKLVGGQPK